MKENTSLAKWRKGEKTLGAWISQPAPQGAEMLSRAGFDWLCVDLQHGLTTPAELPAMIAAVASGPATPIVRVPSHDPALLMWALDMGALGVIIPMVETREQTEALISACRYPPAGSRSFGPIRAAAYGADYAAKANDEIACIVMVETRRGLDNLEDIVSTPGLDGVYIGPSDLGLALGLSPRGDTDDPLHLKTVEDIRTACKSFGVAAGIHTSSREWAVKRVEAGFDFVTVGSDLGFMATAAAGDLAAARSALV
jgi:4-hydroxy-2-oxoheptanedioate aldolase